MKLVTVSCLLCASSSRTFAQGRVATISDSTAESQRTYSRLFEGIELSPQEQSRALAMIRQTFRTVKIDRPAWPKVKALVIQRDSVLRTLIRSRRDKELFDKRTAAEHAAWP